MFDEETKLDMCKEGDLIFFHDYNRKICVGRIRVILDEAIGANTKRTIFLLEIDSENQDKFQYSTMENIIKKLSPSEEFAYIMENRA